MARYGGFEFLKKKRLGRKGPWEGEKRVKPVVKMGLEKCFLRATEGGGGKGGLLVE